MVDEIEECFAYCCLKLLHTTCYLFNINIDERLSLVSIWMVWYVEGIISGRCFGGALIYFTDNIIEFII